MNSQVIYAPSTRSDAPALADFLFLIGEELALKTRNSAEEIVDILFQRGGIVAGWVDGEVVALMGYFCGTEDENFTNSDIGFVYVAAIVKEYRHRGTFRNLMAATGQVFVERGLTEFRCHAAEDNPYTNVLYSKFAEPIRKEKNRRGLNCILYANTVANVVEYLQHGPKHRPSRIREVPLAA